MSKLTLPLSTSTTDCRVTSQSEGQADGPGTIMTQNRVRGASPHGEGPHIVNTGPGNAPRQNHETIFGLKVSPHFRMA
jgi:hypothetical protein